MPETIEQRRHRVDFGAERSIRYHQRRKAHYDRLHKWIMFSIIMFGTAAFAQAFGHLSYIAGLPAAALGALDLVYSFGVRAREHEYLCRDFTRLLAEIRETNLKATDSDVARWEARRAEIETAEPPIYWAVDADVYNEVAWSRGSKDFAPYRLGWRRLFMNWVRFESTNLLPSEAVKGA